MWNPLVCHEKPETNYVPREIFWSPSSIFFTSLCIPDEILHSFLYHANALPFFKSFFVPCMILTYNVASHLKYNIPSEVLFTCHKRVLEKITNFKCCFKHEIQFCLQISSIKCMGYHTNYLIWGINHIVCKVAIIGTLCPVPNVMNFLFVANNPSRGIYSIHSIQVESITIHYCYYVSNCAI